ncbi:MAG: MBL fold metallo-hydrolase [Meiothermus sp.]|nr:MBL fold metallo-hydrolase [Meiothermus sp.]
MPDSTAQRLTHRVVWLTPDNRTDRPSLAHLCGQDHSLLLDVGASPGHTRSFLGNPLLEGAPPLLAAVLTHWHWDHGFGGSALEVPVVAHRRTHREMLRQSRLDWSDAALDARVAEGSEIAFCRDYLRLELPDRSDLMVMVPQIVFDSSLTLDLGGLTCEVHHVGGDHSSDSSVVWVPEEGLLFLGDCLYQRLYAPVPHYTPAGLQQLLDRLEGFEPERVILGHEETVLDASGYRKRLAELRQAQDLATRGATADGDLEELVGFVRAGIALEASGWRPNLS